MLIVLVMCHYDSYFKLIKYLCLGTGLQRWQIGRLELKDKCIIQTKETTSLK